METLNDVVTNFSYVALGIVLVLLVYAFVVLPFLSFLLKRKRKKYEEGIDKELHCSIRLAALKCPKCPSKLNVSIVRNGATLFCGECGLIFVDHHNRKEIDSTMRWTDNLGPLDEGRKH